MTGPVVGQTPTTARTWCGRCKATRTFAGERQVSDGGVVRIKGRCPVCGLRLRAIIGKEA